MASMNPVFVVAASAAVVGIATVVVCTMQGKSSKETVVEHQAPKTSAPKKSKKADKKKPKAKDSTRGETSNRKQASATIPGNDDPELLSVPVEAPKVIEEETHQEIVEVLKKDVEVPETQQDDSTSELTIGGEKRPKKAKETSEQKAARLERQKIAKSKKVDEEPEGSSSHSEFYIPPETGVLDLPLQTRHAQVDGWAVVKTSKEKPVKKAPIPVPEAVTSPTTPAAEVDKREISVDAKKVGRIIGEKGATLKKIQELTGAIITTPKDKEAKIAIVEVSGPPDGVAKAEQAIRDLVTKGYAALLEGDDFSEGTVSVHPTYINHIIGKAGAVRKALQDATGVKISIPENVSRDQETKVKISLAGPGMKCSEAKTLIKELTQYYHTAVTHPGYVHEELDVPSPLYNLIIGAKGSEIKHIQSNFKVSVYIPNESSITQNILVVGEPTSVQKAKAYILKIVDKAGKDKEAAVVANDAWAEKEAEADAAEERQEAWMERYIHPDKRPTATSSSSGGAATTLSDAAESVLHAAAQSAWGSVALTSSEGW